MTMRIAELGFLAALAGCAAPPHPTYEFEALYAPAVATPSGLKADLAAYAAQICGGGYNVLDQIFVGEAGPSYVRVRFACS
jgi:hypothetical protein